MKSIEGMSLVGGKPVEWECDGQRGYWGYSVHIDNGVWPEHVGFPAFTHSQMVECARVEDDGVRLLHDVERGVWAEAYEDGAIVECEPFVVDGLELYALGSESGWAWGEVER